MSPFDPSDYRPPRLLRHPHAMTVTLAVPRRRGSTRSARAIDIPVDGGHVRVLSQRRGPEASTLLLVHGLTGSADSRYMVGLGRKAFERGYNVVRFNARGAMGTEGLARPMTHVGLTVDVGLVVDHIRELGCRHVHLVGYSMGGNLVLKLAAERASVARSVAAVCPAADVTPAATAIDERPGIRFYRDNFLKSLKAMLRAHDDAFRLGVDREALRRVRTIREFDAFYTAPAWGFDGPEHYWREASAISRIDAIDVPTMVLAARDDVLVPFETMAPFESAPNIEFIATEHGGHCAFVAGNRRLTGDPDRHWGENRVLDWVRMHDT